MMDLALKDLVFAVLVSTTQTIVFEVSYVISMSCVSHLWLWNEFI